MIILSELAMKLPDQRPLLFSYNGSIADRSAECNYWPGAGALTPFMYSLMNLLSVEKPVRINSRFIILTFVHLHTLCPNTVSLILSIGNSVSPSQSARRMGVCYPSLCLSHDFNFKIIWWMFHFFRGYFCCKCYISSGPSRIYQKIKQK